MHITFILTNVYLHIGANSGAPFSLKKMNLLKQSKYKKSQEGHLGCDATNSGSHFDASVPEENKRG